MGALEAAVRITEAWLQAYQSEGKGIPCHESAVKACEDIYDSVNKKLRGVEKRKGPAQFPAGPLPCREGFLVPFS